MIADKLKQILIITYKEARNGVEETGMKVTLL